MRQLAGMHVRSVLLTSGTLAPLDSFAHELQLPFKISLENPHVIDPSQVALMPPCTSPPTWFQTYQHNSLCNDACLQSCIRHKSQDAASLS